MIKKILNWPIEIVRTIYTKLVNKIFGKRCECTNIVKDKEDRQKFTCVKCGKTVIN
tara:strand:+ start:304 stop:471 length:168 start_codon:yes stop_codon:yes gene_type:complete